MSIVHASVDVICHISDHCPGRRVVKLLRILSPQAELSRTSSTSAALTALLALLRVSVGASCSSSGLGGRLGVRADAKCQSASAGGENGDPRGDAGDNGPRSPRVGEPVGVIWIEFDRLRIDVSSDGIERTLPPDRRSPVCRTVGEKSGLPARDCWARSALVMSSSSTKISGTLNVGIVAMRPCFFWSIARRNRRAQYSVSKKPTTTLRLTASSTRCRRALRRRNSSSLSMIS